jgi:hypothetical protein
MRFPPPVQVTAGSGLTKPDMGAFFNAPFVAERIDLNHKREWGGPETGPPHLGNQDLGVSAEIVLTRRS